MVMKTAKMISLTAVFTLLLGSLIDPADAFSTFEASNQRRTATFLPARNLRPPFLLSASANNSSDDPQRASPAETSSKAVLASTEAKNPSLRRVHSIQKYSRLPVWPAWNGVLIWLVNRVLGDKAASKLEDAITGRVGPNFFEYRETDPFIMLVHHCHSFGIGDPLRFFQRTFFPEGFPAHAHRGFCTATFFLHGGFLHRDSMGVQQTYGAEKRHGGKHTQWLDTGAGLLHEEMFDIQGSFSRQELYQLWLNVPASHKMDAPSSLLLGGDDETPTVVNTDDQGRVTETLVLAGAYQGHVSAAPILSHLAILNVKMEPGTTWCMKLPVNYKTVILYLRQGSLVAEDAEGAKVTLPVHHTVLFETSGSELVLEAPNGAADFLLLTGEPLNEPCVARGSMVMTTAEEINQAYADYQTGLFGQPWDHKLSEDEWREHVKQYPSQYQ